MSLHNELKRVGRLLKLLQLLQAGRGHNAASLARECGVSRRTIFRDLDTIRLAGLPLQFDPELERYFIPTPQLLPATNFTPAEALAMIVMAHELGASQQLPFFEPARSAALKLENSLPRRLRDELQATTRAIRIKNSPVSANLTEQPHYETLVAAVAARRAVRIEYESLVPPELVRTKIRPYQLLFSRRSWYVIGHSSYHRETRTFHLGRIQQLETLDEKFSIPRGFSIERYLRNAWHLIPEPGPDARVVVRFQPRVAQNVADVSWHPTQQLQFNADGTLDFEVTVSGLNEISWWILGYGDQAEVLEPPELREKLKQRAKDMLANYEKMTNDGMTNNLRTGERPASAG